ncbi:glycosyltransferase family 2 protein [Winogradskyella helgolandensis]|uniref:glycosyltransferase family 2 protein n=1 Tax=Winogradskyella helgolandensis TaxID=2697010 RepID=UPI0015BFC81A|nr:glycosyltransferase family 2 protein [Winogradskyella helgolandensis]
MENQPLVSVLMTVYNREKYIAEAIESVLASTYQNWELIIVDDRSKDSSVEIAKRYESKDKRVRVYINEVNLGDYPNRNQAASYAKGKYLKYVDADDMIYPYGLEQLVFNMEQFPEAGYGLCTLNQDKDRIFPFELSPREAYVRHYLKRKAIFIKAPLSSIINREIFFEQGQFSGKRMLGDFEMWHKLSQTCSVVLMQQGITWYREHDEQEMSTYKADPMQPFQYILLAEKIITDVKTPLKDSEKTTILKWLKMRKARSVTSSLKHSSLKKTIELYKASGLSLINIIPAFFSIIKEKSL